MFLHVPALLTTQAIEALKKRYSVDPLSGTPEDFVVAVADRLFFGG